MKIDNLLHRKKRRCKRGVVKSGPRKGRCKKRRS
jgi:hypothetical protein